jgi:hypothetical protein
MCKNQMPLMPGDTGQPRTEELDPTSQLLNSIPTISSLRYQENFCKLVTELSDMPHSPDKKGDEWHQGLHSSTKRSLVHFATFEDSWLPMNEVWFGIFRDNCLGYAHFSPVKQLNQTIMLCTERRNQFYSNPLGSLYAEQRLDTKTVHRFCCLPAIKADQMDPKPLKRSAGGNEQHRRELNAEFVDRDYWGCLTRAVVEKCHYMAKLIESKIELSREKMESQVYSGFLGLGLTEPQPLTMLF